jgi:probable nitrogen fixation protein
MTTQEVTTSSASPASGSIDSPFLKALARLVRSEDSYGAWDKKPDSELLAPFVVTKEARRAIPIIGDPDPDILHRVDQFYQAVGLAIELKTGLMASPMMKMSHEGFGRVVLTTGKLVVFAKSLRDVHRFGFETLEALDREGEKAVGQAIDTINSYPEVARA